MEKQTLAIILFGLVAFNFATAQADKKKLVDANKLYSDSAYLKASELYNSVDASSEFKSKANYNAANALYRADSTQKAIEMLQNQAQLFSDAGNKAKSYHNLGNAYVKEGKLKEAVDAYKQSLINNPSDEETRYNFTKAKQLLKQQEEQQKKDDKKDEKNKDNKDQEKKDEKQDEKQEDKKEEEQKQDQKSEEQKQQEQEQKQQEQKQKQQEQKASRKQAEQMLNALNQEEKGIQKKVKRLKGKGEKIEIEKDW